MTLLPEPKFDHLASLTTPLGIWEHANHTTPRFDHGFCTDDNARALIVLLREAEKDQRLNDLMAVYMRFIEEAAIPSGGFHNRRRSDGAWTDAIGSDDSQGRAIWALGSWIRRALGSPTRDRAILLFEQQRFESPSPRANAFAILGATEILAVDRSNAAAAGALRRWASHLRASPDPAWPWPETRLAYENARIPEAMIAAGDVLGDDDMVNTGLRLLKWLLTIETRSKHFSFTPVGGWAPGEPRPGFDQQPTEAAAVADACVRASLVSSNGSWLDYVIRAGQWLIGANDGGEVLYDPATGGCFDGLTKSGVNLNQGAESTLAALSTLQRARYASLATGPPRHLDIDPDGIKADARR